MKVTITNLAGEIFSLEVSEDMELENFKAFCEFECGIPSKQMFVVWNGNQLQDDKKKLKDYGIQDNDMLLVQSNQGVVGGTSSQGQHSQPTPQGIYEL